MPKVATDEGKDRHETRTLNKEMKLEQLYNVDFESVYLHFPRGITTNLFSISINWKPDWPLTILTGIICNISILPLY